MAEDSWQKETVKPVTYLSFCLGPNTGANDVLIGIRVVPTGRKGNRVFGRTLNYGELDSGQGIVLRPGDTMVFPAGKIKATIQDIDRENTPGADGYAAIANTIWTWSLVPPAPDLNLFRYLFSAGRRLDSAHALCVVALDELDSSSDEEPFIQARARMYRALGHAELMCIALHRAIRMMEHLPRQFQTTTEPPTEVERIASALKAIRDAFEHIEERALGNVRGRPDPDAESVFAQTDFLTSGVLRYGTHSLDLRAQIVPVLISARRFLFDIAVEKAGAAKTVNVPIEVGPLT